MKDWKNILIIILIVALAIVSYIAFKPAPINTADKFIEMRIDSLQAENKRFLESAKKNLADGRSYKRRYDSLSSLPIKIKKEYVEIYKNIDNSSVNSSIAGWDTIFTNSGLNK